MLIEIFETEQEIRKKQDKVAINHQSFDMIIYRCLSREEKTCRVRFGLLIDDQSIVLFFRHVDLSHNLLTLESARSALSSSSFIDRNDE